MRSSNYDKHPTVNVPHTPRVIASSHSAIVAVLTEVGTPAKQIVVDVYPGTSDNELLDLLRLAFPQRRLIDTRELLKNERAIREMVQPDVTDDPVFGRMTRLELSSFFDPKKLSHARQESESTETPVIIYGVGAALVCKADVLIYADLARWEIQQRQRAGQLSNLGVRNTAESVWRKYKWAFFVDWRVADAHKRAIWNDVDFFIDAHDPKNLKLIDGEAIRAGLKHCVTRPFRVVPFFDPGVWGGQWMKDVCDLPRDAVNYAWCFDCVPEENSLLLRFGTTTIELPSIDLVYQHPRELLGASIPSRFGAEFPIRFDFLDTFDGGNLSLQVHPSSSYIDAHFRMPYTQDESYYMIDARPDACVYLGMKTGVDPDAFVAALNDAQFDAKKPLDAERFVNKWSAQRHDHFLIPAGTVHCSGRNGMVLEISATPYIFTFKLWDWARLDLDGKPRAINITHGSANINYDRDTEWTRRNLINRIDTIAEGGGWREERTGLHETEFIETRRHWFTDRVPHDTHGTVNVLNLVQGDEAIVESMTGAFEPFVVHFAETFIVPAAVGGYTIRPGAGNGGAICATLKAFVREPH